MATAALDTGADPALTELLTEPALLDDPDQAGVALLPAYVAVGGGGLTLTATGPDSWRRSGYVEAPGSGAYRFFVVCPPPHGFHRRLLPVRGWLLQMAVVRR